MSLDVGGVTQKPDWPKLGPSLLIASALIVAIRTAKWAPQDPGTASEPNLDREIDYAVRIAGRVLSALISHKPSFFPQAKEPWFVPNDEDTPK